MARLYTFLKKLEVILNKKKKKKKGHWYKLNFKCNWNLNEQHFHKIKLENPLLGVDTYIFQLVREEWIANISSNCVSCNSIKLGRIKDLEKLTA